MWMIADVHSNVHSILAVHMCNSNRTAANASKHRFGKLSYQLEMLPLQDANISYRLKDYALKNHCLSKKVVLK